MDSGVTSVVVLGGEPKQVLRKLDELAMATSDRHNTLAQRLDSLEHSLRSTDTEAQLRNIRAQFNELQAGQSRLTQSIAELIYLVRAVQISMEDLVQLPAQSGEGEQALQATSNNGASKTRPLAQASLFPGKTVDSRMAAAGKSI
jgi:hypothetical protein